MVICACLVGRVCISNLEIQNSLASPYKTLNLDKITCHIYIEIIINQFENSGVSTLLHCMNDLFQT